MTEFICVLCGEKFQKKFHGSHPRFCKPGCQKTFQMIEINRRRRLVDPKPRFLKKIQISPTGCWLWQGNRFNTGYGCFWLNGKRVTAHRASIILFKSAIDPGKLICHKCGNRCCVNPDHLYVGTHLDNQQDRELQGTANIGSANPRSKLTEVDVLNIRRLLVFNCIEVVAPLFGVSPAAIYDIKAGRTWKHVF